MGSTGDTAEDEGRLSHAAEAGMRLRDWLWRRGGNCEHLQLAYLFPWLAQPLCLQAMGVGVGGWDTGMNCGKEGWRRR